MLFIVLIACSVIIFLIYALGLYNERYWKRRGVIFHKKNKVVGPFWYLFTDNKPLYLHFQKIYKEYPNEPAIGIGGFLTPTLYVRDPANVQAVLSSDFNSFYHRGVVINEKDTLANNILFLNGNKWKLIRQSMTPLFTSVKLKNMFYIMDKSAQDFVQLIKETPELRKDKTFKTMCTFCSAAVCATIFGVSTESIFNSPFLKIAENFQPNLKLNFKFAISNLSKSLFELLDLKFFADFEDFFIGAIKQVLRQRERENVKKHDFADICMSLQKNGTLKDPETGLELEPTDELLAAQAFFFFIAGVEPIATVLFGTLIEIGKNSEVQERVHAEIDSLMFDANNEKLTYDAINDMVYLDMVINEAMRLYPPIALLSRQCVEDTVLPVGNIAVEKGTKIFVPVFECHHDPKYFPNPEEFIPERFSRENRHKIPDMTYLPFGKGKRICIGMRYASIQVKACLVHLLRNFSVKALIGKGGIKYLKETIQTRLGNVNIEFLPR